MKRAFVVLLILLFAVPLFAQEKVWFTGTYDAAKAKAEKEDKLLLINFFQDG